MVSLFPSKTLFLKKFFAAVEENTKLRDAYFARFDPHFISSSPEASREAILMSLTFYGGYRTRRRLLETVPVVRNDTILDIGPEMGMECFMLAEVYGKVLVAEPDGRTAEVLEELAKHYITEDGRKAADVIEIKRAGIIPHGTVSLTNCEGVPTGPVFYNASGAKDIVEVFGKNFAGRIYLNHLAVMVPQAPKLKVLLEALVSYCRPCGVITWCDSVSELAGIAAGYAKSGSYPLSYNSRCTLTEIEKHISELLPGFDVAFNINNRPHQLITVARRR
jgi:hypothetical protein